MKFNTVKRAYTKFRIKVFSRKGFLLLEVIPMVICIILVVSTMFVFLAKNVSILLKGDTEDRAFVFAEKIYNGMTTSNEFRYDISESYLTAFGGIRKTQINVYKNNSNKVLISVLHFDK